MVREYKLLAELGKGGMGTVYRALHTKLDREVALKILPAERTKDPEAVDRFQREMKAVGKLEHPHIVRATDAGEQDGTHFLVMEYVEGLDLSELVQVIGPLPVADACEVIRQAAVGLQAAHEHGMVHRDIKPSNLMLAANGRVKILDLGLALLDPQRGDVDDEGGGRDLTSDGQIMGTFDYMAPEQAGDSHGVDIRADI
jgi:serine/threonine protein kinase